MDNVVPKILIAGAVLLVLVVGVVIFGAFLIASSVSNLAHAQEPNEATVVEQQVSVNEPITINKIISTPVVYKDLQITLEGKIVGWVTKNAIIVSEPGEKNSGKKLLVISNQKFRLPNDVPPSDVALGENVNVSFTGTAGILKINDGDTSLGDEDEMKELKKWNKYPVIFASSVVQK